MCMHQPPQQPLSAGSTCTTYIHQHVAARPHARCLTLPLGAVACLVQQPIRKNTPLTEMYDIWVGACPVHRKPLCIPWHPWLKVCLLHVAGHPPDHWRYMLIAAQVQGCSCCLADEHCCLVAWFLCSAPPPPPFPPHQHQRPPTHPPTRTHTPTHPHTVTMQWCTPRLGAGSSRTHIPKYFGWARRIITSGHPPEMQWHSTVTPPHTSSNVAAGRVHLVQVMAASGAVMASAG
jgi:hypothetical protein